MENHPFLQQFIILGTFIVVRAVRLVMKRRLSSHDQFQTTRKLGIVFYDY